MTKEVKKYLVKVIACAGLAGFVYGVTVIFLGGPIPYVVPAILVICGAYLGFVERTEIVGGPFLKRGVALLFGATAIYLSAPANSSERIPWQPYSPELLEAARKGGRPVMIDFTANWCQPCRDMERNVFSRRKVVKEAEPFLALRADLSEVTPQTQRLAQQYRIEALPTIVFIGPDGKERANLRLVGYEIAENFVQRLQQAR